MKWSINSVFLFIACSSNLKVDEDSVVTEGTIDAEEGDATVSEENTNSDTESVFTDADGDGFTSDIDCVDDDASIHPMADELCDSIDNNCDGITDLDAIDRTALYVDSDGDGYGAGNSQLVCSGTPNMVSISGDCDDDNHDIRPAAEELCDGLDNDCDQQLSAEEYDQDGDGFIRCTPVEWQGQSINGGDDCDDNNESRYPGAEERCDGLDNDCDGTLMPSEQDDDGDTYVECVADADVFINSGDCDDENPAIHPYANEVCDGFDNDCDNLLDDNDDSLDLSTATTSYIDDDQDGYGDMSYPGYTSCNIPPSFVGNNDDCDDQNVAHNPAASEICDGIDNNCDGSITDEANSYAIALSANASSNLQLPAATSLQLLVGHTADMEFHFCAGTHKVYFELEENVAIIGHPSSAGEVILDGDNTHTIITTMSDQLEISLSDVTLSNGSAHRNTTMYTIPYTQTGGAIFCENSQLHLNNVQVYGNEAAYGAGIFANDCTIQIESSGFETNSATRQGGAIWMDDGVIEVSDSTFVSNQAGGAVTAAKGGAFYIANAINNQFDNVIVQNNQANATFSAYGGGFFLYKSHMLMNGQSSVSSQNNGGFSNNSATTSGGAISIYESSLNCYTCDFGTGSETNIPNDVANYRTSPQPSGYIAHNYSDDVSVYCYSERLSSGSITEACQ